MKIVYDALFDTASKKIEEIKTNTIGSVFLKELQGISLFRSVAA